MRVLVFGWEDVGCRVGFGVLWLVFRLLGVIGVF